MRVAAQAVREVLEDLYPGVCIDTVYTVHTFGRDLGFKLHIHLGLTKGGLKDNLWVEIDELPGNRLASKWRYLLCEALRQMYPSRRRFAARHRPGLPRPSRLPGLVRKLLPHRHRSCQIHRPLSGESPDGNFSPDCLRWPEGVFLVHRHFHQ